MNTGHKVTGLEEEINLEQVEIDGEFFYKISNVEEMRPFFMSIVSD